MSTQQKYVVPIKRAQEIKEKGLSQEELTNEKLFPILCEAGKTAWTGKTFKTTIYDLIASEKLSAQEKAAQEEARKAMEGWARLSLTLTKDDCIRFNEKTEKTEQLAKEMQDPWYYNPGKQDDTTNLSLISDDASSDEESILDEV